MSSLQYFPVNGTQPINLCFRGVVVELLPCDPDLKMEVRRAYEDAGDPGNPDESTAEILGTAEAGQFYWYEVTPDDELCRFFSYRHVGPEVVDGNWSPWGEGLSPVIFCLDDIDPNDRPSGTDPDVIPELRNLDVALSDTGEYAVVWMGDEDVVSVRIAVEIAHRLDPVHYPDESTTRASTAYEGRLGETPELGVVDFGDTVYASAYAYDGAGGTGVESPVLYRASNTRETGQGGGQCANVAGQDAAVSHRSPQGVGTVSGYVYDLINLDRTAIKAGDLISFCFDAHVGPVSGTIYDYVACNGKWGRRVSGLVYEGNASLDSLIGHGLGSVKSVNKDGIYAYEVTQDSEGYAYAALVDTRLGYDEDGDPDVSLARSEIFLQAKYQYEGTSSPRIGGTSRHLGAALTGDRWKRIAPQEYFMTSPFMGFVQDPTAGSGSLGYLYFNSRLEGFSAGYNRNYLVRLNTPFAVTNIGSRTSNNEREGSIHVCIGPGSRQWVSHLGNPGFFDKDPMVASDSTYTGPWFPVIGLWNNGTAGNQLSGPNIGIDIGRGWWWQVLGFSHPYVTATILNAPPAISTTAYVACSDPSGGPSSRAHSPSVSGAADEVWANFKDEFPTLYSGVITFKGGLSFPEWKCDAPFRKFEIWDGPSWQAGSTLVDSCDVPVGIMPGDFWDYSYTGGLEEGGEVADVSGLLILDFLDVDGNVISSVESDETTNAAYERITYIGATVPVGTQFLRFRQEKRGTADAWVETNLLQVNYDPDGNGCCEYSDPLLLVLPGSSDATSGAEVGGGGGGSGSGSGIYAGDLVTDSDSGTDEPHVARLYSSEHDEYVTADDLVDAIDEHKEGATNLLKESLDPRSTPSAAGEQFGTAYPRIDFDEVGIDEGDTFSVRGEGKTES